MRHAFRHLPRLVPYARPHVPSLSLSVLLMALAVVASVGAPWPLALLVDSALGDKPTPPWLLALHLDSTSRLVLAAVGAGFLLVLLSSALTVLENYVNTRICQKMTLAYRSELFRHSMQLPLSFHDTSRRGGLMFVVNQQSACMGEITVALLPLLQNALTVFGMLYVVFRLEPTLALLSLAVVPFVYCSTGWYGRYVEPRLRSVRDMEAESLSIVHEALSMVRVILTFGRNDYEHTRFQAQGEQAIQARVVLTVQQTLFSLVLNLITAAGTALVLGFGAHLVIGGSLSIGELLVVLAYVAAVYAPLTAISSTLAQLQQQLISLEAALEVTDTKVEIFDRPGAQELDRARGEVRFEGVDFDYPDRAGTLRGVSFVAPPGALVALVGPTGAGKSTLMSLLPRLIDPSQGRVLLDGVDLRDLTVASVRRQCSIVLQEPLLFTGSILENIRYGRLDACDEEVMAAARAANAHDFIGRLPSGYATLLGERGQTLSGGERQRVAIARAFLRDCPLLILDEPTSSVDSRTESVILEALERLTVGRTTFMIAHRLSTVRHARQILVVDDGRLVEQGTHDELVAQDGLYAEMVATQQARPTSVVEVAGPAPAEAAALVEVELPDRAPTPALLPAAPSSAPSPAAAPVTTPASASPLVPRRPVVVVLGMLTKMPVAGVAWQTLHYLAGFERLGYDAYYVEAHGRTPSMLMDTADDDGPALAAAYLDRVMRRFGFAGRWAYQAVHDDERVLGMSATALRALFARADLVINLHGGTEPLPEHSATGRLVYLETDPVQLQVELHDGLDSTRAFLDPHVAFFTFGENLGLAGCGLPVPLGYDFRPTRQPVVLDYWPVRPPGDGAFTTIGNWRQAWREVQLDGQVYGWSKHTQFGALLDLPARRPQVAIELALSSCTPEEQDELRRRGFAVRDGLSLSRELDPYRDYVVGSRAELTAAKDQNVRLRSGWFSDRSATYLASGRPVITQDTGFGRVLPTGVGLHAWRTLDDAAAAVDAVLADPVGQSRAAREIAEECFDSDKVLGRVLDALGLPVRVPRGAAARTGTTAHPALPDDLPLQPLSRRPLVLPEATRAAARALTYPRPRPGVDLAAPDAAVDVSVVIVCHDGLELTRLCLASLLGDVGAPSFELLVVDNASTDGTAQDVAALAAADGRVRLLAQPANLGFAAGVNAGLAEARGQALVLLNNDTVVPPGTLAGLVRHLRNPEVGAVGPVTNRCGNEAEIASTWATYGELVVTAGERARSHAGQLFDLPVLTMFCAAFRREVLEQVGPLDERFGIGMFEDDDWAERVRACGLRLVVAEDVLVHHHGEGSLGALVPTGAHAELFARNRAAFEAKWARAWEPHAHRPEAGYLRTVRALCDAVRSGLPESARPLVVSKGDSALLRCGRSAGHFPQDQTGHFPGYYPGDSESVVDQLEALCDRGYTHLVLPATATWWLDHYTGLAGYLQDTAERVVDAPSGVAFRLRARRRVEASA